MTPGPLRFADLHAHYPMRVAGEVRLDRRIASRGVLRLPTAGERVRAFALWVASKLFSHSDARVGYRVTAETLSHGDVVMAMSVLTRADDELDLEEPLMAEPQEHYFENLLGDLELVERQVRLGPGHVRLVHDLDELDACMPPIGPPVTALVHAIEGGFMLGATPAQIDANVAELAGRGVAYVTLAHLFFRHVAANAPALPFIPDGAYDKLFPQPNDPDKSGRTGLTELGVAAVTAMVRHGVMVDVSHMREDALHETAELMRHLDPDATVPMIATHAGYRFDEKDYMLSKESILAIKERQGVVGLIMAQHQLNDGLRPRKTRTLSDSLRVIHSHIERIREITGGLDHVALGTDFDGFIKPTLVGFENSADLPKLAESLVERYELEGARKIASGNALTVLRRLWAGGRSDLEIAEGNAPTAWLSRVVGGGP